MHSNRLYWLPATREQAEVCIFLEQSIGPFSGRGMHPEGAHLSLREICDMVKRIFEFLRLDGSNKISHAALLELPGLLFLLRVFAEEFYLLHYSSAERLLPPNHFPFHHHFLTPLWHEITSFLAMVL